MIVDAAPGTKGRPAFLHMHGGGFVSGFAGQFNPFLQAVAQNCGCLVVSVDYRLAPETRFPGSLEDNYTALRWLYKNSAELGVDRKRIAIGGESAGGSHSTLLAIAARDRREIPILFQLLIYPAFDDRTGSTRQASPYTGQFIWNAGSNRFGWTSFLGVPAGSPTVPAGAVPARVENLAGLPPAFIGVGALDLFVDEDVEYARRLINAGVPTELLVVQARFTASMCSSPTPQFQSDSRRRGWLPCGEHSAPSRPRRLILLATRSCINRGVARSLTEESMKYICLGYLEARQVRKHVGERAQHRAGRVFWLQRRTAQERTFASPNNLCSPPTRQ